MMASIRFDVADAGHKGSEGAGTHSSNGAMRWLSSPKMGAATTAAALADRLM